mgnify:CR=1 FL=1
MFYICLLVHFKKFLKLGFNKRCFFCAVLQTNAGNRKMAGVALLKTKHRSRLSGKNNKKREYLNGTLFLMKLTAEMVSVIDYDANGSGCLKATKKTVSEKAMVTFTHFHVLSVPFSPVWSTLSGKQTASWLLFFYFYFHIAFSACFSSLILTFSYTFFFLS